MFIIFLAALNEGLSGKHYAINDKVKTAADEVAQITINRILRGEGGTLLLRETETKLRSGDVIH